MPRIDTYTAETKPATPDQPLRFMESGEAPSKELTQQAGALGTQLTRVGAFANEQAVNLEWLESKHARDNASAQAMLDTQNDPKVIENPQLFFDGYNRRMAEADMKISNNLKFKQTSEHYDFYRRTQGEEDRIKAQAKGIQLQIVNNKAKYATETDTLSTRAAAAVSDSDYKEQVAIHNELVDRSVLNRAFTPKEAEIERIKFRRETATKNMRIVGNRDPSYMRSQLAAGRWPDEDVAPEQKIQIMAEVEREERLAENNQNTQTAKAQENYFWDQVRLATKGLLPDTAYEMGSAGLDPMLRDPLKWERLKTMNTKAKEGTATSGVAGVESIRLSYGSIKNPTKKTFEDGIEAINLFIGDSNPDQKTLHAARMAVEHFNTEINKIEAENRADVRAAVTQRKETEATIRREASDKKELQREQERQVDTKIKSATDLFEERTNKASYVGGIPKVQHDNRRNNQLHMLKRIIRENPGITITDAVDRVLGKNVGTVRQGPPEDESPEDAWRRMNR